MAEIKYIYHLARLYIKISFWRFWVLPPIPSKADFALKESNLCALTVIGVKLNSTHIL